MKTKTEKTNNRVPRWEAYYQDNSGDEYEIGYYGNIREAKAAVDAFEKGWAAFQSMMRERI